MGLNQQDLLFKKKTAVGVNHHDLLVKLENVKFISVLITERNDEQKQHIGFAVKISINRKVHQLMTARGQERVFKNLNTLIGYIKDLPVKQKQILISLN